jgi:hypothetical protein
VADGPPLAAKNGTRWQPFAAVDRRCLASLSERGRGFATRTWDFDSRLSDGRWVMTFNDVAALSLPSHPDFLVQVFPGAGLSELLDQHQRALRALEAVGLNCVPIAENPQTVTQTIVNAFFSNATLTMAASALWRALSRRSPHAVPVAER